MQWALVALLVTPAPTGMAQSDARMRVVVAATDQVWARRTRRELELLSIDAIAAPAPPVPVAVSTLLELARASGAIASISLVGHGGGVDIWVADRATGKTSVRSVADASDVGLIAVQAVELLRASLLELRSTLPQRGEVEAPPQAAELEAPPRFAFLSRVGPAFTWSPGGLDAQAQLEVEIGARVDRWVSIVAPLRVPLAAVSIAAAEGDASGFLLLTGLALRLDFADRDSVVHPTADLGVQIAYLELRGAALAPRTGAIASRVAAIPYSALGLAIALADGIRVRLDGWIGFAAPGLVVRFAGRPVAQWGVPVLGACISFQIVVHE